MPAPSTLQDVQFGFSSGDAEFSVVQFHGTEAISTPFVFDIDVMSADLSIDFDSMLQTPATLTIYRGDESANAFEGVLASFELREIGAKHAVYRAVLVPRLWLLTLTQQNRIFQEKTIPQILDDVLKEHEFSSNDYTVRLTQSYPTREYVVQYQESDLSFLSRWMEHEGIFYFFDAGKLVIADDQSVHQPIAGESKVPYRAASGLSSAGQEAVSQFMFRQVLRQERVLLKDYNWRRPDLDLKTEQALPTSGKGILVEYGAHYKDTLEGKRLAKVRGEELECRKRIFMGEGNARSFRAGFQHQLTDHPRSDFNAKYLLVEVQHEGSQSLTDEEGVVVSSEGSAYRNTFVSIQARVPFRPERVTPKPRIYGTLNAKVDGASDGTYAEVDDQGRYKVILPFDLSGKDSGKASRFVRMAQPYAGPDYGIHFPLHKGTEVLLTFIDGDPDRPIISGAVPNPDTASPVKDSNQTASVIRDHRGNEMVVEGQERSEQIRLFSPNSKTTLLLGGAIVAYTEGSQHVRVLGESRTHVTQDTHQIIDGNLAANIQKNHAHVVGEEHLIQAKRIVLQADTEICLQVGDSFVSIVPAHIGIESKIVDVNSGGSSSGPSISSLTPKEPVEP